VTGSEARIDRPDVVCTDGTVTLRCFTLDDVVAHLEGEDDDQVRWVSGGVGTEPTVTAMVHRASASWRTGGARILLAVEDERSTLVGFVESNTDHEGFAGHRPGDANISYGLYPAARGHGYASRAVVLMERFAGEKGARRAMIHVDPANERSIALARRLAYVPHGDVEDTDGTARRLFVKDLIGNDDVETPRD